METDYEGVAIEGEKRDERGERGESEWARESWEWERRQRERRGDAAYIDSWGEDLLSERARDRYDREKREKRERRWERKNTERERGGGGEREVLTASVEDLVGILYLKKKKSFHKLVVNGWTGYDPWVTKCHQKWKHVKYALFSWAPMMNKTNYAYKGIATCF